GRTFSCTDTLGNTFVQAATQAQPSDSHQIYVHYGLSRSSGPDTVTCTVSGAATIISMAIHEYSGVTGLDKTHSANGTGTTVNSASTATTSAANELLFVNVGFSGSGKSVPPGASYTSRSVVTNGLGNLDMFSEDRIVSATGSYNGTCAPNASN